MTDQQNHLPFSLTLIMTTSIDHTETPSSSNTPPDMADLRSLLDLPDTLFRFLVCHDAGPVHRVAVRNADHEVETIGTLSEDGQVEVGRYVPLPRPLM